MKQVNLTISFEERKLSALKLYMEKKDAELEAEMQDALNRLYAKYVPTQVREYIDDVLAQSGEAVPPKRTVRPPVRENTEAQNEQP